MRSAHIVLAAIAMAGAFSQPVTAQEAPQEAPPATPAPTWVVGGTCTLRSPETPQQPKFLLTIFSNLDRDNQRQLTSRLQITAADGSIPEAASVKGMTLDIQPAQWTELGGKVDIVDGLSMVTVAPKVTPAELVGPIKIANTLVLTLPEGGQLAVDLTGSFEATEPLEACIASLPR